MNVIIYQFQLNHISKRDPNMKSLIHSKFQIFAPFNCSGGQVISSHT